VRDGAGSKGVLIGLRNEIFFQEGLDTPNQLESIRQTKFYVKSNFGLAGSKHAAIAALDLPQRANQRSWVRWAGTYNPKTLAHHARPCAGHPRLTALRSGKAWMAGTSAAITEKHLSV
jgi:hypothetical protein